MNSVSWTDSLRLKVRPMISPTPKRRGLPCRPARPRQFGDSTTSIVVAFILVVIATTAILWQSGTIDIPGLRRDREVPLRHPAAVSLKQAINHCAANDALTLYAAHCYWRAASARFLAKLCGGQ